MQILAAEAAMEQGEGMQITCKNCNKRKSVVPKAVHNILSTAEVRIH